MINRCPALVKIPSMLGLKRRCEELNKTPSVLNSTLFLVEMQSYSPVGVSDVDPLPCYRPADAAEVPQVTDESSVERVLLRVAVFEVHDALA